MMAFVSWLISVTWKILLIVLLFSLFKAMKNGGKEAIESTMELVGMTAKTATAKYKRWLFKKYKEAMMDEPTEPPQDGESQGG